ncbi:unnamed protein product [Strongylus vulgaris]|uniref:Uncharacterized protein n=1 Tax=Strongylus vulgaris TaxID=40348 RepID=A0A3P7IXT1_STRVU|nr:unnamed protein product [Strongylus vulgaris]
MESMRQKRINEEKAFTATTSPNGANGNVGASNGVVLQHRRSSRVSEIASALSSPRRNLGSVPELQAEVRANSPRPSSRR